MSLNNPDERIDMFEMHYIIASRLKARGFAQEAAWPELIIACREAAETIADRLIKESKK